MTRTPALDVASLGALGAIVLPMLGSQGGLGYDQLKDRFRQLVTGDPIDTLLTTVLGGSYLFYLAEKDTNRRCKTLWDALVFISTSLSVGYDKTFAETPSGKAIATFMMTFGPAMTARAFDPPAAEHPHAASPEALELQRGVLEKLEAILRELQARRVEKE
ncbi:MAG: ion channel [Polyangiaceae bacterium]